MFSGICSHMQCWMGLMSNWGPATKVRHILVMNIREGNLDEKFQVGSEEGGHLW